MVQYEMGSENLCTYMNHQAINEIEFNLKKLFFLGRGCNVVVHNKSSVYKSSKTKRDFKPATAAT